MIFLLSLSVGFLQVRISQLWGGLGSCFGGCLWYGLLGTCFSVFHKQIRGIQRQNSIMIRFVGIIPVPNLLNCVVATLCGDSHPFGDFVRSFFGVSFNSIFGQLFNQGVRKLDFDVVLFVREGRQDGRCAVIHL
jgi:hypothetical protein